jgi:hypothetical protein
LGFLAVAATATTLSVPRPLNTIWRSTARTCLTGLSMSPLVALILLAAVLVIVTIIVSLATAYDLGRQRATLKALDQALLEIDDRAEKAADQRQKVQGSLELHQRQRDEKVEAVRSLLERLRQL